MVTSVLVPRPSLGRRISKRTAEPISSLVSASRYTPAALTLPVNPLCLADEDDSIVIGRGRGKGLPVRASDNLGLLRCGAWESEMFIPRITAQTSPWKGQKKRGGLVCRPA